MITQIGSLPFRDVDEAISYSRKFEIPFLPELVFLNDKVTNIIDNPGKLSCLEKFKKYEYDLVKVQTIGPATLVSMVKNIDKSFEICYNHLNSILDGLNANKIIAFIDEPLIGQCGFDYQSLWNALFVSFDCEFGIHTCGSMDWDILFDSNFSIISFDATKYDLTNYPKYRNGKKIAWGIDHPSQIKDFREGDLVTSPCGLGFKSCEEAYEAFNMLSGLTYPSLICECYLS